MAIKKQQLYSSLWASADELRGGMDASEYKNYVLTLLFMKYVSDKYKADPDNSLIEVPENSSFDYIVSLSGDKEIGDKINKAIKALAEKNDSLLGVIDTVDFNDTAKLGRDKEMVDCLSKLVKIFNSFDLSANTAQGDDLLGDAYEYFMLHFATESGKSKGQFYTPAEVSAIIPKVIGINKNTPQDKTIYDPACGSGSLLIKAALETPNGLSIYGQEKEVTTTALCKMNMILHGNETAEIAPGGQSTLAQPYFRNNNDKLKLKTFDFAVANPPFSYKSWSNGVDDPDLFQRFEGFERPPEKNGDYAFLLHIVKSLKSNGKAGIILPHGVLFRGNAEKEIRTKLINKGYIKGIIGLPANLFYGTGIPAAIIIIDKENAANRSGIFMIDASKGFKKDGNKNRLRDQDIHKIVDVFNKRTEIAKYSKMVSITDIIDNDYNLNIPRYIDSSLNQDIQDLNAHLNGGIPNYDIENLAEYWQVFSNLKNTLFEQSKRKGYYQPKIAPCEVKNTILNSEEFSTFKKQILKHYQSWKIQSNEQLYNLSADKNIKDLIHEISENLLVNFSYVKLLNKYDIYQILMSYWQDIMQDDVYLITVNGWQIGKNLRILTPIKDKNGKNVYKENHDFEVKKKRYKADLIPYRLLTEQYFKEEKSEIEFIQENIDNISAELENFIEENSGEEGLIEYAKNDKGNINKSSVSQRLKEAEDKEEVEALQKCQKLIKSKSDAEKLLKEKQNNLYSKLINKYQTLQIEEIKRLVIENKWHKYLQNALEEEITRKTSNLAVRIKTLEERYSQTLPELENKVNEFGKKVEQHLKKMGLLW